MLILWSEEVLSKIRAKVSNVLSEGVVIDVEDVAVESIKLRFLLKVNGLSQSVVCEVSNER